MKRHIRITFSDGDEKWVTPGRAAEIARELLEAVSAIEREKCPCYQCISADIADKPFPYNTVQHMVICETCGCKRCPHAEHHDNPCTGSNEPGQPGAIRYPARSWPPPPERDENAVRRVSDFRASKKEKEE